MALYEGASLPHARLGVGPVGAAGRYEDGWDVYETRHATLVLPRSQRRARPVLAIVGSIAMMTVLGFVYLTQTLEAATDQYQIDALLVERQRLVQELKSDEGTIARLGSEPQVIAWAQHQGLDWLSGRLRLAAH